MRPIQSPAFSLLAKFTLVSLIAGIGALLTGAVLAAAPSYRIESLDTGQFAQPSEALPQGGFLARPVHISNNGQFVVARVVDIRNDPALPFHVAILDRQTGNAELISEFAGRFLPLDVNNRGDVLAWNTTPSPYTEVVFWSRPTGNIGFGEPSGFESIIGSGGEAVGRRLNNFGQVLVGSDNFVLWDPVADTRAPVVNDNPTFPGGIVAIALNDAGQVVGQVLRDPDPAWPPNQRDMRAFVWDAVGGLRVLPDPGFMTPNTSPFIAFGRRVFANAINDAGRIAGAVRDDEGELFAAVWDDETAMPDLLPCTGPNQMLFSGCSVWWIGNGGDIIGGVAADETIQAHFVWDDTGDPYLLRDRIEGGPVRCVVNAIADDGAVSGGCEGTPAALLIPIGGGPGDTEAPAISDLIADPNPVAVGERVDLSALVDDSASGGSTIVGATYTVEGGPPVAMAAADGAFDNTAEEVTAEVAGFGESGIYEICATAEDSAGNTSEPACVLLAVYDPSAGFVTGGGWIDSPAGALVADSESAGKANFGFVARYRRGSSVPGGSTEFQFHQPGLNFHSAGYDWLVITAVNRTAEFHGTGTINGATSPSGSPYRFMVQVLDGKPDAFRIRIWWVDAVAESVVYDSGLTELSGGSIVVHHRSTQQ